MNVLSTSTALPRPFRVPPATTLLAVAGIGVLTWLTAPMLGHSAVSAIPRPTHGLALALLLLAPAAQRAPVALLLWGAVLAGASLAGADLVRSIGGASLVVAQAGLITLGYERWTAERPLDSVPALLRLFVAAALGSLPMALLGGLVIDAFATEVAPELTWVTWWLTASTSCVILVPMVLAVAEPSRRPPPLSAWRRLEFLVLMVSFAAALLDVFAPGGMGLGLAGLPHTLTSLPFLVWGALRFGLVGSAAAAFLLVAVSYGATAAGSGAYVAFAATTPERLQVASLFLATVTSSVMLFAVALAQRAAEERRAEAAYAQLHAIVDGAGDLIAAVDTHLTIVAVNPAWIRDWQRLSGIAVRPGMSMRDALAALPHEAEAAIERWNRALAGEHHVHRAEYGDPARLVEEYEIIYSPVRGAHGAIVGASQVVRNVTERRRRELEEAEARRLESVGRLAGGVAHDFNNLMTAVTGYTSLVAGTLDRDDPRRDDLAEIERAAARAGELTQQLLAFARRQVVEPKVVDPGALVEGFSRLLAPLLGKEIVLIVHNAPALRAVRVDPTQFEQVVMNLAINARDAMDGRGQLRIEVANDARDGIPGVSLVVRDSGHGMTAEVQQRIFEPFFTTKPLGQGTGLGLPTVHGIVHQAGGHIAVESMPGVGTTFRIFFPAATPARDGAVTPGAPTPAVPAA